MCYDMAREICCDKRLETWQTIYKYLTVLLPKFRQKCSEGNFGCIG